MLTAVIIDDESGSRSTLALKLKSHCSEIQVLAECEDGLQGIQAIEELRPDIIFLDVEMPRMNGFTMLQQLKNRNFELVFVTAYDNYAIQAIKFSAMEYLVKPVEVEDLKSAVQKAMTRRRSMAGNERLELLLQNLVNEKKEQHRIAIPSLEGLQFVSVSEIIYLEALGNYTILYLRNAPKITVTRTLKDFEEMLPSGSFIRIHHSSIINRHAVEKYIKGEGGQVIMSNGVSLNVARRKKEDFLRAVGQ